MRHRTIRLVAVAACALALTGCGVGMQDLPLGRTADGPAYTVTLQLATAEGLLPGADVRTGQRVIGRVRSLATDTIGATARLSLEQQTELPADVLASVELPSALGNPFIRLTPPPDPSARPLRDGDVIVESATTIGPQVESALATVGTIVTGSGLGQLQTVVEELDAAFAGRSGEVRGLMDTMNTLMATANANRGEFDAAIDTATRISGRLTAQQSVVDGYLDAMPAAVRVLGAQRDSIASLLRSTTQLAETADAVAGGGPDGLGGMISDASTVVATLASFNSEIGGTLDSMNTFMGNFIRSVHGDYLNFDGALDVPASIRKLLTGGPLPGGAASTPVAGTAGDLAALLRGGHR
ncbi:MCE family protein [Rhodococcus olei]|uniref:MCE family protein n=1 Tax=Rhodococcus olei TaxID=2161675 RepID=A0ABP8NV26_9NOCA